MIEETIFNNGDDFFNSLQADIASARKFIHLETYIFDQDLTGNRILSLLAEAANRGVHTQLLLDGVGSSAWTFAAAQVWRQKGIELKFFHALPWQKHPSAIWKLLTLKKIVTGFFKLNRRNHRKICIIDDDEIFVSSMNISDRHLPSLKGSLAWRDMAVKIKGINHEIYLNAARDAWNFSQHHHGRRWRKISRQKKLEYDIILNKIKQGGNCIWITNPYFVPDLRLTRALCRAAWMGLDVKILLPGRSDILGLKFAMESYYNALLTFGVKIYEYNSTILHAKILIVDDWVSVGSFNLDYRSIFYNLETNVILGNPENVALAKNQFLKDVEASTKIELAAWKQRSWIHRILEKFFLLFQGWL